MAFAVCCCDLRRLLRLTSSVAFPNVEVLADENIAWTCSKGLQHELIVRLMEPMIIIVRGIITVAQRLTPCDGSPAVMMSRAHLMEP